MRETATERARAYLAMTVDGLRQAGKTRLPPYGKLAARAGVAPLTMLKALRELRDRGVVTMSHGTGTTLLPDTGTPLTPQPRGLTSPHRWKEVRASIYRDIVSGHYPAGSHLPTCKELQARHGVSSVTVRHALRELCREGFVERTGRRHRVPLRSTSRPGSTVVLIAFGGERRGSPLPDYQSPRTVEHLHSLHQACVRAGLNLKLLVLHYSGGGLAGLSRVREFQSESTLMRRGVLGFIVWDITLPRQAVATVLDILTSTGRPVCLLNETGRSLVPAAIAQTARFKQFRMATEPRDARAVGDFLLRKGHTRIAYIDTPSDSAVSRNRYRGLCEAFAAAGYANGVALVSAPLSEPVAPPDGDLGEVFRLAQQVAGRMMAGRKDLTLTRIRLEFEAMLKLDGAANSRCTRERLFPRLERLLAAGTTTAWVAYSDSAAVYCLDFLECAGRRVPDDIAVIGFDDSLEAVYHGLTSYNFGGDGYMHAMVEHIVNPSAMAHFSQPVELDGFVVERETT